MAEEKKIIVPDIGGASDVDVIEILVKVGDVIDKDSPLITLESDKASMEIPSPMAGVVRSLKVKIGDKISEGDVILTVDADEGDALAAKADSPSVAAPPVATEEIITPIQDPLPASDDKISASNMKQPEIIKDEGEPYLYQPDLLCGG
jgi:pyruvate dehydrogenase E2 component (dihydrolipoamide acetyltransferase)